MIAPSTSATCVAPYGCLVGPGPLGAYSFSDMSSNDMYTGVSSSSVAASPPSKQIHGLSGSSYIGTKSPSTTFTIELHSHLLAFSGAPSEVLCWRVQSM